MGLSCSRCDRMKLLTILALACILAGCGQSQSAKDIAAEQQLTGRAKEQRTEYYRTADRELQESVRSGGGGSTTGLGNH